MIFNEIFWFQRWQSHCIICSFSDRFFRCLRARSASTSKVKIKIRNDLFFMRAQNTRFFLILFVINLGWRVGHGHQKCFVKRYDTNVSRVFFSNHKKNSFGKKNSFHKAYLKTAAGYLFSASLIGHRHFLKNWFFSKFMIKFIAIQYYISATSYIWKTSAFKHY